jgi:arylsulfate sulfotransferase
MKRHYLPILIYSTLLFQGCARNEYSTPELSLQNSNVLLPAISFKSETSGEVFIEYWPQDNPGKIQRSGVSAGEHHRIILFNVKPSTRYNYRINNINTNHKSDVFDFETGMLPDDIVKTTGSLIDTSQFKGYILVRKLSEKSSEVILDNEGDVVWYHVYDSVVRRPFTWTNKKSILSLYDSAQIVEHDLYGGTILDIKLDDYSISNRLHHEVLYNDGGEIVALTLDSAKMDLRKLGGSANQYIRADGIVILTTGGEKKWEWNLLNVHDPVKNPIGKIDLKQSLGHANSLAIDKDGHYVVSFRDFSQLWKVNSVDGSVIWKLGENGDFKMDPESYFINQHSIHFNKQGELVMFDNGDKSRRPNSRVLSFQLDENTMEATVKTRVVLPLELSAYKMCSAELISEGKYLICTSRKEGIIAVVNDEGEILWRVDLSHPSYRAYYLQEPF